MNGTPVRIALALALAFAPLSVAAQAEVDAANPGPTGGPDQSRVDSIVNTGHVGAVLDLQYDAQRNLLFSAGEDGTVRIWAAGQDVLYRSLRVTRLAAQMIAVDPAAPRVAVVVSDGLRSFSLTVWDWETQTQLFRLPLPDAPLFLRFSGQGSFIVYGESSWQSLKIIDATTGDPVRFHPEGFGMIAFAEVSRSEKTIMTYEVSGRIAYWDMASGILTREMATTPYLSRIRISRDRRYIVGNTGKEAVLIDTLSGAVRGRAPVQGDISLDISPDGDQLAGVAAAGGSPAEWDVGPDALVPVPLALKSDASLGSGQSFQALCYGADGLYLAGSSGRISFLSRAGDLREVSRNMLAEITAMDARGGLLAVGSRDWIRIFSSDLLAGKRPPTYVRSILLDNPWKAPVGLSFLSDTMLLAWTKDDSAPRFALLDLRDDAAFRNPSDAAQLVHFRPLPSGFRAPLIDIAPSAEYLIGIENGGMVRVTDLATGFVRFESRVPAIATVIASSPGNLIGGRNTALAANGSLVKINTRTGETVAMPGRNVFTWELMLDPGGPAGGPVLYSLGVDGAGATNLIMNDGPGLEKETVIASDPEENLDASIALDPATHVLYASLGRARIVAWDGAKAASIPAEYTNLRNLRAVNGLLMSLDRDSVLLLADQATGASLGELSIFPDGEWAATVRGGGYLASPGGDAHVKVFVDGALVKANEDYRLRIETR